MDSQHVTGALFEISGVVIRGDQRGRTLGFPTANVELPEGSPVATGIYAGTVDGRAAAISVGVRPTFGRDPKPGLEAYILDFAGDLYGRTVAVRLIERLRPEAAYDSVDALVAQMHRDVAAVRARLLGDG